MKMNPKNIEEIKNDNITTVFDLIRHNDGITRVMISEKTNLTRMNVTRIISLLMDKEYVFEEGEILSSRGRPAKKLHINADAIFCFSANIDVDGISVAVLNLKNEIILKSHINAFKLELMEEYVDSIYSVFQEWKETNKDIFSKIECVAFATPGIIDPINGEIEISAQLGWKNVKIVEYATKKFNLKTIIDNDVKSALLGEISLYEKEKNQSIAYMCIGYGVGVGVWIEGKILRGANNNAGEIGHISIDYNGKRCRCGRRGCLDTVLNITAFLENAKAADSSIVEISDIVQKYNKEEKWAIGLVDDASMYFSMAINNIIHAYDPNKIVLGGKFFELFPEILDAMISSKYFTMYGEFTDKIAFEESHIGEDAYLIGAAINSLTWIFEKEFMLQHV